MSQLTDLKERINNCLLSKLSKSLEESEDHLEFKMRVNKLNLHFPLVVKLMDDLDLQSNPEETPTILASLYILYLELQSNGPWSTKKCLECSKQLNHTFEVQYGFSLNDMLSQNIFKAQEVFDSCIDKLHEKLTPSDFKKYPSLIEVYYKIIHNVKNFHIVLNPLTTLPISLLLIEDFIISNKMKGLRCCLTILHCMKPKDFEVGNYHEVIYGSLKKCNLDKDLEVTKLALSCLLQLLTVLPYDKQTYTTYDAYKTLLDQMYSESNLYRKATYFNVTKEIIKIHGVNCVKWKMLKTIFCDALDICSNEEVAKILLPDVLLCLVEWIKYSWCFWKLSLDHKLLAVLIKLLFTTTNVKDDQTTGIIRNLISTLITLCTEKEQRQIYNNLSSWEDQTNPGFLHNLEIIRSNICV